MIAEMVKGSERSNQAPSGVDVVSYDELFDQSQCPILIFTSGNYTIVVYHDVANSFDFQG